MKQKSQWFAKWAKASNHGSEVDLDVAMSESPGASSRNDANRSQPGASSNDTLEPEGADASSLGMEVPCLMNIDQWYVQYFSCV